MFDILVYLVENYYHAGAYPDSETLSKRLSAAGFDSEEITTALAWLNGLEDGATDSSNSILGSSSGFRIFTDNELARITPEARGFLCFLEDSRIISPALRELIIERIAALDESGIELDKFKLIVLMALWNRREPVDALVLEELLASNEGRRLQ
jgi:Smg protein